LPPAAAPDPLDTLAIRGWNLMGGTMDWAALPVIAEILGVDDMESFIQRLVAIRDWQAENRE
jgi:hypothetical protein